MDGGPVQPRHNYLMSETRPELLLPRDALVQYTVIAPRRAVLSIELEWYDALARLPHPYAVWAGIKLLSWLQASEGGE